MNRAVCEKHRLGDAVNAVHGLIQASPATPTRAALSDTLAPWFVANPHPLAADVDRVIAWMQRIEDDDASTDAESEAAGHEFRALIAKVVQSSKNAPCVEFLLPLVDCLAWIQNGEAGELCIDEGADLIVDALVHELRRLAGGGRS